MRRLPVYILIDTSGSMVDEPIDAVRTDRVSKRLPSRAFGGERSKAFDGKRYRNGDRIR